MRLVALTGGIATGKTTTGNILREFKIPIIDSDQIAHEVELPTGEAYPKIVAHFGDKILSPDGSIDRKALGAIVFKQESERQVLNRIVHPIVFKTLFLRAFKLWLSGESIIILDIPLFFEGRLPRFLFNDIVTVQCTTEVERQRLCARNNISTEEADRRMKHLVPMEKKISLSTIVIDNNGTEEELRSQVEEVVKKWKNQRMSFLKYPSPFLLLGYLILIIALILKLI